VELKRKIKFSKESKTKNQNKKNEESSIEDLIWKKITNYNYGPRNEIENKFKFEKIAKNKK